MLDNLTLIANQLFSCFSSIWVIYTGSMLAASVLVLWLLRRIVNLIRHVY